MVVKSSSTKRETQSRRKGGEEEEGRGKCARERSEKKSGKQWRKASEQRRQDDAWFEELGKRAAVLFASARARESATKPGDTVPPRVKTMRRFACGSARLNCARGTLSRDGSTVCSLERAWKRACSSSRASGWSSRGRKYICQNRTGGLSRYCT